MGKHIGHAFTTPNGLNINIPSSFIFEQFDNCPRNLIRDNQEQYFYALINWTQAYTRIDVTLAFATFFVCMIMRCSSIECFTHTAIAHIAGNILLFCPLKFTRLMVLGSLCMIYTTASRFFILLIATTALTIYWGNYFAVLWLLAARLTGYVDLNVIVNITNRTIFKSAPSFINKPDVFIFRYISYATKTRRTLSEWALMYSRYIDEREGYHDGKVQFEDEHEQYGDDDRVYDPRGY